MNYEIVTDAVNDDIIYIDDAPIKTEYIDTTHSDRVGATSTNWERPFQTSLESVVFICHVCSAHFVNRRDLRRHSKNAHEKEEKSSHSNVLENVPIGKLDPDSEVFNLSWDKSIYVKTEINTSIAPPLEDEGSLSLKENHQKRVQAVSLQKRGKANINDSENIIDLTDCEEPQVNGHATDTIILSDTDDEDCPNTSVNRSDSNIIYDVSQAAFSAPSFEDGIEFEEQVQGDNEPKYFKIHPGLTLTLKEECFMENGVDEIIENLSLADSSIVSSDIGDQDWSDDEGERSESGGKVYKCEICGEYFRQEKYLGAHFKDIHSESLIRCKNCSETFISVFRFNDHLSLCGPRLTCHICSKTFTTVELLEDHMKTHAVNHQKPPVVARHECEECGGSFSSAASKLRHQKNIHKMHVPPTTDESYPDIIKQGKRFLCSKCPKVFLRKLNVVQHVRVCKENGSSTNLPQENQRSYPSKTNDKRCPICSKVFSSVHSMWRHVKEVHHENISDVIPTYNCEKCNSPFPTVARLNKHMKIHEKSTTVSDTLELSGSSVASIPCSVCRHKFTSETELHTHMETRHLSEDHVKPQESSNICRHCSAKYLELDDYLEHMKNTHGEEHFSCGMCEKSFKHYWSLTRHLDKNHQQRIPPRRRLGLDTSTTEASPPSTSAKSSNLICKVCDRKLGNPGALRQHYTCHMSNKPYSCDICPYYFLTKVRLSWHKKTVHGEDPSAEDTPKPTTPVPVDPHKCRICHRNFLSERSLKIHISIKHTKKRLNSASLQSAHKSSAKRDFTGKECGKSFVNKTGMSSPWKTHRKNQVPSHGSAVFVKTLKSAKKSGLKCNVCGTSFVNIPNLRRHLKNIHNLTFPYKCFPCGRLFKSKTHLTTHVLYHHSKKSVSCSHCWRKFDDQNKYADHLQQAHIESKAPIPYPVLVCPTCGDSFDSEIALATHSQAHLESEEIDIDIVNRTTCSLEL